jgi:RND family efflux transporter MFP subunit
MAVEADLATLRIDRTKPKPRAIWPWVLLVLVVIAITQAPKAMRAMQGVQVTVTPVIKASTLTVSEGGATLNIGELAATGYVVADRRSALAVKLNGQLKAMHVVEAQHVKKGDPIAEIDSADIQAQMQQVEAEIAAAEVDVARMKADVAQAEVEANAAQAPLETLNATIREQEYMRDFMKKRRDRNEKLAAQSAIAVESVEDREIDMKIADARIDAAKGRLKEQQENIVVLKTKVETLKALVKVGEARIASTRARMGPLLVMLRDTKIAAPYDGVVIEKVAEVGEIVAPVSVGGAMARGSICTLADWNSLQAEVDVAESYIGRVKPNGRVQILVDALPGKYFAGKVLRILPRADRSKATVQVRVQFLKLEEGILPDMGLRVKFLPEDAPKDIELGPITDKLLISTKAVATPGEGSVWVVQDGLAVKKKITTTTVKDSKDWLLVTDGLVAGDTVVVKGTEGLQQDGQKVQVIEPDKK